MQIQELSPREKEFLLYASHGFSNKEIAYKLGVSPLTIKVTLYNAYVKLNVNNGPYLSRAGAVGKALREGIIE